MNDELRAALDKLDAALAEARAAMVPQPQPEPEPEPTPTEKPWVEVPCADGAWRYYRIVQFERTDDGRWRVHGDCISSWGTPWPNAWNTTAEVPFRIWEECQRKMVPCPEPPSIELTLNIGDRWRVFGVTELSISPDTGNTIIRCLGNRPQYAIRDAIEGTYYVTESPAAIRALCAEKGVPCVGEPPTLSVTKREVAEMLEDVGKTIRSCDARLGAWRADKPKTVAVDTTPVVGKVAFAAVDTLFVEICQDGKPYLRIAGMADGTQREEWTRTPIADIRTQAAAAGIELPKVTVSVDGYQLTAIKRADCHVCDNGSLLTDIIGVAEQYGEHTIHTSTLTPAQVCQLCELAGWPKPKVLCVFTHCDGSPCEYAPRLIGAVTADISYHATKVAHAEADTYCSYVREPVAVVQRMIDACREGE